MAVKTIGTGGDYSTIQAWEDAVLATLLGNEEGQCFNQEFSSNTTSVPLLDLSAHDTTLGTLTLTAAAGASFQDNASVRSNGLRYNASNGAALKNTGFYAATIYISGDIDRLIISKLQITATNAVGAGGLALNTTGNSGSHHKFKDLILESAKGPCRVSSGSGGRLDNCVFVERSSSNNAVWLVFGGMTVNGCTVVRPSSNSPAGTGIDTYTSSPLLKDTAIFGFTTAVGSGFSGSSSNNATDQSSGLPGSSNQHSVTYSATTPFVQADATGNLDFRLANDANALINNGVKDATNGPADISGTTRADPCEIGVWELAAGGGGTTFIVNRMMTPVPGARRTRIIQL